MLQYMLTFKECTFNNAGTVYCKDQTEAVREAIKGRNLFGLTPEAVYKYNPATDRYDILAGRFTIETKEA